MMTNTKLREQIIEAFNLSELQSLCFDLNIKYENLSGETIEDKARELINYCDRHGIRPMLIHKFEALRPNYDWGGGEGKSDSKRGEAASVLDVTNDSRVSNIGEQTSPPNLATLGQGYPHFQLEDIRAKCWPTLYHWNSATADAIRLIGAQDEFFSLDRTSVSFDSQAYSLPKPFIDDRVQIIEFVKQITKRAGSFIFDGPCVRLSSYRAASRDPKELKHLHLTLGRMTWFDYIAANQRFGDPELARFNRDTHRITSFIDFDALVRDRDVRASQLSNVLPVYLTATTSDGFLVYSQRTGRVGAHRYFKMSAISENIHPEKDGVFGSQSAESIFKAAARGIAEELSPNLVPDRPATDILLLGLTFHFDGYHPGLLFHLPFSKTRADIERACRDFPGKDFIEGWLRFIHLDDLAELEILLSDQNWFAAGKASIIRTLEYLSVKYKGLSMAQAAQISAQRLP